MTYAQPRDRFGRRESSEPPPPKTFQPIRGKVVARICPSGVCPGNRHLGRNQGPPVRHPLYDGLTCPRCGSSTAAIRSYG